MVITLATKNGFSQVSNDYTPTADGMSYKIISRGGTAPLKQGQFLEMNFANVISHNGVDSMLNNTREQGGSQVMGFDSVNIPPTYYAIFSKMKAGDSLSTRTLVDSVFKQSPAQMPKYMKSGDYLYTNISIDNVLKTQAEADSVTKKNMEVAKKIADAKAKLQIEIDDKLLAKYLADNNIKATKMPSGVYVSIAKQGVGPVLTDNNFTSIKYKGRTLKGIIFDTNMDASKGHQDLLKVNLTNDRSLGNGVIPGMTDALLSMQKGTVGTMYIPSSLGYGARGAGGDIGPNENLIFDVEVVGVQTIAQVKAEQAKAASGAGKGAASAAAADVIKAGKEAIKNASKKVVTPASKKTPVKKPVVKSKK